MNKDPVAYHCEDCPPELMAECLQQVDALRRQQQALGNVEAAPYTDETIYAVRPICLRLQQEQSGGRRSLRERLRREPEPEPVSSPSPPPKKPGTAPKTTSTTSTATVPAILYVPDTHHRIALPEQGKLVLGRSDLPNLLSPDVDLTFDDRYGSVSRYHASVISRGPGHYVLTDLDSQHGTWVNGVRLQPHRETKIVLGDEIRLGSCFLLMAEVPAAWQARPRSGSYQYFLYSTFTGHIFALPCSGELLIGRSDQRRGIYPELDLSMEGEAAYGVSRRHAMITCEQDGFYITDLRSSNGTKIDGVPLVPHQPTLLRPGQHVWLGGLVLCLDVME